MKKAGSLSEVEMEPPAGVQKKKGEDKQLITVYNVLEVIVLLPIILVIVGLFLIPTILYALPDSSSEMGGNMADMPMENTTSNFGNLTPTCSVGFYLDDGENGTNTCRPQCGEFLKKPFVRIFFENMAIVMSIIASIAVFVLAATVQRSTMLVFPSIILVYVCISSIIMSGSFFIGFLDNYGLYCGGQRDYLFLLGEGNETPYTSFTGMVFTYCLVQLDIWTCIHSIFLFWSVKYPYSFRSLRTSGRMRYAHIITVILAVVLPIPGPLVLLFVGGYMITDNPNLITGARNADLYFYFNTLPACILVAITCIMLLLLFWTVFKIFVIKKLLAQQKVENRVGHTEFKIAFVILYFAIFAVMGLGSYTYFTQNSSYLGSIFGYVECESSGFSPINCFEEVLDTKSRDIVGTLLSISTCTLVLWPVMIIVFTINPRVWMKEKKAISSSSKIKKTVTSSA